MLRQRPEPTYRIESEPPLAKYALPGSFACKIFPKAQRRQSSDCSQLQTRMDQLCRSHSRQKMSRVKRLTKAKTGSHLSVGIQAAGGEELTDMTADAVRPVRTVRFAVMNLLSGLVLKEDFGKAIAYISVFSLSSPVVFFKTFVMSIITVRC